MKLNCKAPILSTDGNQATAPTTCPTDAPLNLTVGLVCAEAIIVRVTGERLSFDELKKRGELAERLARTNEVDLTDDQWLLIKEKLADRHHAMIIKCVADAVTQ